MQTDKLSFIVADGKVLPPRYRKMDWALRVFEIVFLIFIITVIAMMAILPNFSFADYPTIVYWTILLIVFSVSWNWSFHLGWNQRFDGRMRYVLEEEGLSIYFNRNKLKYFPYSNMRHVKKLEAPLSKVKRVQLFGRKYWVTPGLDTGTCEEHPTLLVYAIAIDEGVLIDNKYETILITPKDKKGFIQGLETHIQEKNIALEH